MNTTTDTRTVAVDAIQTARQRTIRNGLFAVLVGLVGGFGLVFSMLGGISLSPLPVFFQLDFPGTPAGWKAVHLGMLMNGLMAIIIGLAMRRFALTPRKAACVSWGTIIAVWGNFAFYFFGLFAHNHGLTLGGNRTGPGNFAGALAFAPALLGAVTLFIAIFILAFSPFRSSSTQGD
ncbi:MAG: hypothetical protein EPN72_00920 [Nevskiaceae bacterium]|nr:MAG: hypothetical protein EPN63_11670 [Nevskiaceae bacterium]TBR74620.1 MAG: hypothetical protein EPN72_00920 [Nevskiaceae bacterium]